MQLNHSGSTQESEVELQGVKDATKHEHMYEHYSRRRPRSMPELYDVVNEIVKEFNSEYLYNKDTRTMVCVFRI